MSTARLYQPTEQELDALEDAHDLVEYHAAMADEAPSIPWEVVKAELEALTASGK